MQSLLVTNAVSTYTTDRALLKRDLVQTNTVGTVNATYKIGSAVSHNRQTGKKAKTEVFNNELEL